MAGNLLPLGGLPGQCRAQLAAALDATVALGVATNKSFLAAVLRPGIDICNKAGDHATREILEHGGYVVLPAASPDALMTTGKGYCSNAC